GPAKSFRKDGIVGFTHGKISRCGVCSNHPQRDSAGSLFIHGDKEWRVESTRVVRVEHLQAFDNAVTDQEFSINANLPRIPIAMRTDQRAGQGPDGSL